MGSSDAGFSLIEVLVALAIGALLMAFAYRGLALGTRGVRASAIDASVIDIARRELEKVGVETPLAEGQHEGRTGNVDWTLVITPYRAPSDNAAAGFEKPRAYWVDIEARAKGRPPRRLTTLKLDREGDVR